MATYKIHPGIGVARLGNSETAFYLAPENPAAAPQECDAFGNPLYGADGITPVPVTAYKDAEGKVKRQGARFQIYVYDDESPEGRPLKLGDPVEGGGNHGVLTDIQWRVYLANKKASWYEFEQTEGEHGYADDHPRRNAAVTDRDRLVIDPGPRIVDATANRRAHFDRDGANSYATTFPPKDTQPFSIDTLGELVTDDQGRLIVLGGHGRSGSELSGPGQPRIDDYANTDGWYDDTSDGPVMARLTMFSSQVGQPRYIDVEYPAWAVVGYPRFAPQILDMVTMDEVLEDLFIREFATDTSLYGQLGAYDPPAVIPFRDEGAILHWRAGRLAWNRAYRPWFFRDIWPILFRPDEFRYLTNILQQSNYPHDQARRGTFDPYKLCVAPGSPAKVQAELAVSDKAETEVEGDSEIEDAATAAHLRRDAAQGEAIVDTKRRPIPPHIEDPYAPMRRFLFDLLRRGGEENAFHLVDRVGSRIHDLPLMPLLAGDNPISNVAPSKFLKLTDTQLFLLSQWADGCFIDDMAAGWLPEGYSPFLPYPQAPPATARALDRGVLSNVLGGAFCPGGELGWIMRNPSIYWDAYRIKADRSVSDFLQSAAQANQFHNTVKADYTFSVENTLNQDTDFQVGLQPGDLTKYSALPWQSDFNECTTQTINVTYADWNQINPASGNNTRLNNEQKVWETLWWPAHRPLQSYELTSSPGATTPAFTWTTWSRGVQQTSAGDLKMVTEWSKLGFIVRNPYATNLLVPADMLDAQNIPKYVSIERS